MNKLFGSGANGNVLVCVLEPGNIERLTHNEPIEIDLNDGPWKSGLPAKVRVVIAYSETPIADAKHFAKMHPDMKVMDERTPMTEKVRPHCPECKSSFEQIMVWRQEGSPWIVCCAVCGCALGPMAPMEGVRGRELGKK